MMLDYVVRLLVECHARAYPNIDNHNIVKQRAAIKIQLQTCVCTRTKLAASRRKNLTVSWCTMFFSRFACVHCFWQKHLPFFRTRNERFYTQRHINCRIFYLLFVALWMHTRQWMHILHMRVRYSQCAFFDHLHCCCCCAQPISKCMRLDLFVDVAFFLFAALMLKPKWSEKNEIK